MIKKNRHPLLFWTPFTLSVDMDKNSWNLCLPLCSAE